MPHFDCFTSILQDYQFEDILKDVLEANGIPIEESHSYFLFDERSSKPKSLFIFNLFPEAR